MPWPLTYCEILLNNYLEKDFESMLRPLYWMQLLHFNSRYDIRDNHMTPKSKRSIFLSLSSTLFFCFNYYFTFWYKPLQPVSSSPASVQVTIYATVVIPVLAFLSNFICLVFDNSLHTSMILQIQAVHKILNDKQHMKEIIFSNWLSFIGIGFIYAQSFCVFTCFKEAGVTSIIVHIGFILFDINIIYNGRILFCIRSKMYLWIRFISSGHRQKRVICSYFEIMRAYNFLRQTFRMKMAVYIVLSLTMPLTYLQYCLSLWTFKTRDHPAVKDTSRIIWVATYTIKVMIIVCAISAEFELFYKYVNEAQVICVRTIASSDSTVGERKMFKNIISSHRHQFQPLSACSFRVDGRLPLELLTLFSTYFFVMLQFNLLGNSEQPDLNHKNQSIS